MNVRFGFRVMTLALAVVGGGLLWQAGSAEKSPAAADPQAASAVVTTATLGGPDRYLTYLSTDKPIYRPGEKIYMRGVMLHHATHRPLAATANLSALVEIEGPKGDTVASGWVNSEASTLGYAWDIPAEQAGGQYTIKVSYPAQGYAPAERKFDIRAYRAPRLKSQIRFLRDGYGPGDAVVATLNVQRAEGGVPAGAKVTVIARVDGLEAYRGPAQVDAEGNCQARFPLPADIRRGEGTLAMVIEDGGVLETATKTIPILLQTVDLSMYPEGGELIARLPNRVYFEAFTPARKPADLAGEVLDATGQVVARFRSEHEGRGRFTFTPQAGGKYVLRITEPAGIKTQYPLPEVKSSGVVLAAHRDVTGKDEPVRISLGSAQGGKFSVTLRQREQELSSAAVNLAAGAMQTVQLPAAQADGVLIVTVWDEKDQPLAERLVFRQSAASVRVTITPNQTQYVPGGAVELTIQTTDESGQPLSAVVGVCVTDDSVLEMIEKREQAPRLPVMVLLENDVRELADAHVYLDPQNPQAPTAVDLLLGTQGWRRFAVVKTAEFVQQHGAAAQRALAMRIVTLQRVEEVFEAENKMLLKAQLGGARPAAVPAPVANAAALRVDHAAAAPAEFDAAPFKADPAAKGEAGPAEAEELPKQQAAGAPAPSISALQEARREVDNQSGERRQLAGALAKNDDLGNRKRIAQKTALEIRQDFVVVRQYAHEVRAGRQPQDRVDFTETLFWNAGIRTDAQTGQARVAFATNDAVTSFRVLADAFSEAGNLGSASIQIESVQPFYLEPKLPLEITSGDRVLVPIGLVNATSAPLGQATVQPVVSPVLEMGVLPAPANLLAGDRVRRMLELKAGTHRGPADVVLSATAGPYSDKVTRQLTIKPQGFPIEVGFGGLLHPAATVRHEVEIPAQVVPGSVTGRVAVYPTPLASMTSALERLIQEPYGCFEQTSSTTYPLVMAQQYFMSHQGVDPAVIERASTTLAKGYDRLMGFECKSGGYEWFGSDPGHDALTAYGLLEFTDMAQVRHVDPAMLARTRKWLLAQRDGKGGFARKTHTLHTWIADPECAVSYNVWALLEAGVKEDLSREVALVRELAEKSQNTYVTALGANVLALAGDEEGANHLLDRLAGVQQADGSLKGANTSVIGSGGDALNIETTALAVMAWLKNPRYADSVEKSINYLAESCKGGRYGSTQSTVLALRAVVAYDQSRAHPKVPGSLQLLVDGRPVGAPVPFDHQTQGAIELPAIAALLTPGKHAVEVAMTDGSRMPYSVAVNYNTLVPASAEECKIHLAVQLLDDRLEEGSATEASVVVVNRTGEVLPTPVAIIGIPGGMEVRHDQLKELVKAEKIAAYEVLGREVVLYWRSLDKEQRVELPLSLVAAIPGSYTAPASRAYLYYTDEHKQWVDGLTVEISPKAGE